MGRRSVGGFRLGWRRCRTGVRLGSGLRGSCRESGAGGQGRSIVRFLVRVGEGRFAGEGRNGVMVVSYLWCDG